MLSNDSDIHKGWKWAALLALVLGALLSAPMFFGGSSIPDEVSLSGLVSGTLLMVLVLVSLRQVTSLRWLLSPIFWILLVLVYLVRLSWVLVLDFSAEGFTDNFYTHISQQALQAGITEYKYTLILAFVVFAAGSVAIVRLQRCQPRIKIIHVMSVLLVALPALILTPSHSPERLFVSNYLHYQSELNPGTLSPEDREKLERSGLVKLKHNQKSNIQVTTDTSPRNLILIYLESFNLAFTDAGPLQDLTPNINRLKQQYGHHSNWLSSADVTIEGLISTLCGTIVSAPQGSSTFANTDAIMPQLACLPDVLKAAGYYQVYLGGFDSSFAGKGQFLSDHGYDEVIGWKDWNALGFKNPDGYWGLPDDVLLEQALKRIREFSAANHTTPYNLTLLTLSTHPPGASASVCTPYPHNSNNNQMLDAIHCTDQLIGLLVDQLVAEKLLDNTLLVITADHDIFNLPEVLEHFPDLRTDPRLLNIVIDSRPVFGSAVGTHAAYDLAPTILDLLEVEHNVEFILGQTALEKRDYVVTRNFRGGDSQQLTFLPSHQRRCQPPVTQISWPLNDCEHTELLKLSDQYLFSLYKQNQTETRLCNAQHNFEVNVTANDQPISIEYFGNNIANSFADIGRPLDPATPGFYLLVNASGVGLAGYYYFRPSPHYAQIRLVDTLLNLAGKDQFVLIYKPSENANMIEPLSRLLNQYGFSAPNLDHPFIIASNAAPGAEQVFWSQHQNQASLVISASDCESLLTVDSKNSVIDFADLRAMLKPYLEQLPEI